MPYEWGNLPGPFVPPVMPKLSPEALARIELSKARMRRARQVWDSLRDDVTFDQWIKMGDEALVERAVNKAWDLFVEEMAQLTPEQTWTATIPADEWFSIPVHDRGLLIRNGATVVVGKDLVVVTGEGTLPAWLPQPVAA